MDSSMATLSSVASRNDNKRSTSPNRGRAVPDIEALGGDYEDVKSWRQRCGVNTSEQVKLVRLSHMRYQHPDLDEITKFMHDFGMETVKRTADQVWFGGYGVDNYVYYAQKGPKMFLGGAFEVATYEDLQRASKISGSGQIEELKDAPGGGFMVSTIDPEGFPINLLHGAVLKEVKQHPEKIVHNTEAEKPRKRHFQRFKPGPAAVHKLGHFGLCVTNFDAQVAWYVHHFNLVPTDFLYIHNQEKERRNVAMFAHIDRGEEMVDHHSFFMTSNKSSHVHHCSFEVHDFDTQALGHQWLAAQGYRSVWGVGRHILGSQIFDYWWDTSGNMVEHYTDGDLVNFGTPIGYGPAGDESLAVWGPKVPDTFLS